MIKTYAFEDAHAMSVLHPSTFKLPSREQIRRLRHGDFCKVCAGGERFWARLIWTRGTDCIAIVDNDLVSTEQHGLRLSDLISFTTFNIYQIEPGEHSEDVNIWMLCQTPESEAEGALYVLHTVFPRFIGRILFGEKQVTMRDVLLMDEPLEYKADMPKLLKEGADWFFYNYIKNK